MNIPRYWTRARGSVARGAHSGLPLVVWGWSSDSLADAQRHAQQRLEQSVARIETSGELPLGYGYGDRPLREERVESVKDESGTHLGLITRNAAGCLVLNTDKALFLDVDDPPPRKAGGLFGFFKGAREVPQEEVLAELRRAIEGALANAELALRIYRTRAGFRVLATSQIIEPNDRLAERLLALPQVDPSYRKLCRGQESFRARLQPKAWRCGVQPPPGRFPFEETGSREEFDDWLTTYEAAAGQYATCRLVETLGGDEVIAPLVGLVALHDEHCAVDTQRPLA